MVPVRGVLSHSCLRKANGDNGMVTGFGCLPGIAGEAIVHQAEERIGAEMFALFGSNHRHSKLHHENSQSFRSGGIFASMFTKGQHRGHGDHWAWRLTGNYCMLMPPSRTRKRCLRSNIAPLLAGENVQHRDMLCMSHSVCYMLLTAYHI